MVPLHLIADRFELHGLAGTGGMGAVYRARDRHSGRWVALKLMSQASHLRQDTERFLREAQILAELRHPGIVSYVTHGCAEPLEGTDKEQLYLVMEWLEGESLATRLAATRLSLVESMLLLRRVAEALAVAHQRGIVHRDIKPANLFLRGGLIGEATLLDFGIARQQPAVMTSNKLAAALTRGGEVLGTPEYMSPEQARGDVEIGPAADIFSLGCVMYQCLTGQLPFSASNPAAVLAKILLETPRPVQELRRALPEPIAALIMRMLAKDPAQRPKDAGALVADFLALGPLPLRERASGSFSLAPAGGPPATAGAEQRLFSIVLSTPSAGAEKKEKRALLTRDLERCGAQVEWLLDESLLVTCSGEGNAIDQAARAGRCALLIKAHWPLSEVVLATGRGVAVGQIPRGEVIDRAFHMLSVRLSAAADETEEGQSGVWLDALSAGLLSRQFALACAQSGWLLLREPRSLDRSEPLLGKPTPCVGRESELSTLSGILSSCIENSSSCGLVVVAPPGMGKSRLRREFIRRWQSTADPALRVEIVQGQGDPLIAGTPYKLLGSMLRRLCMISGSEPLDIQQFRLQERLGQRLAAVLPPQEAQRLVEVLGELCGVPLSGVRLAEPSRPALDVLPCESQREEIGDAGQAFLGFLAAECTARPQLWIIEDLQWADRPSVELLHTAIRSLSTHPFMVLALGRPEVWDSFPHLRTERWQEIILQGLSRKACERLVRGALGGQVDDGLVVRVSEQAGGNALFLEEMVRAIAEGKRDEIPDTVLAMLQARLARLPAEARRVLRLASVFGQTFRFSALRMFLGPEVNEELLKAWLQGLVTSELIESVRDAESDTEELFRFRHGLLRDAAYGLLTADDRIHAHCLAAQHLERQGGAAAHYRQALAVLEGQPETPQKQRRCAELLVQLVRVTRGCERAEHNLAQLARAHELLRSAQAAEPSRDFDEVLETHIQYWTGLLHYDHNRMGAAIKHFEAVIERNLNNPDDQSLVAIPASLVGRVYALQGHFGRALWLLEKLTPMLKEDPEQLDPQLIISISFLGYTLAISGKGQRGREVAQRALAIASQRREPALVAAAAGMLGVVQLALGELGRCVQELPAAIAAAEQAGSLLHLYANLGIYAWALSRLGQHEAAEESMARSERVGRELGQPLILWDWLLTIRAEMAWNRGRAEDACRLASEAVQAAQQAGGVYCTALSHRVWAQALAVLPGATWQDVESHLGLSLDGLRSGQARIEAARTQAVWGNLCSLCGRDTEARRHLQAACDQFAQSGLDADLAAARASLRQLAGAAALEG